MFISEAGFMTAPYSCPFVGRCMRKRLSWCLAGDKQSSPAGCRLCCFLAVTSTPCKRKYPNFGHLRLMHHQSEMLFRRYFVIKCCISPRVTHPQNKNTCCFCFAVWIFEVSVGGCVGVSDFSSMCFSL